MITSKISTSKISTSNDALRNGVYAKPFFYNPGRALVTLITSASSASSSSDGSSLQSDNIEDLRKAKVEKFDKLQRDDDSFLKDDETRPSDDSGPNEASPTLLQKKIGKILHKIQLISQFSNRNGNGDDIDNNNDEDPKDFDLDGVTPSEKNVPEDNTESQDVSTKSVTLENLEDISNASKNVENPPENNSQPIVEAFVQLLGSLRNFARGVITPKADTVPKHAS